MAYTGFKRSFCFNFFGWVGTGIVYYIQTGTYTWSCFLASTQIGLLAIVPHAINNLRDHAGDARVGKKTIAVRFGNRFARWEISVFSFLPFALGFYGLKRVIFITALFPLICLPVVIRNVKDIWSTEPGLLYNEYLAKSALCEFIFGCLLTIGILLE